MVRKGKGRRGKKRARCDQSEEVKKTRMGIGTGDTCLTKNWFYSDLITCF